MVELLPPAARSRRCPNRPLTYWFCVRSVPPTDLQGPAARCISQSERLLQMGRQGDGRGPAIRMVAVWLAVGECRPSSPAPTNRLSGASIIDRRRAVERNSSRIAAAAKARSVSAATRRCRHKKERLMERNAGQKVTIERTVRDSQTLTSVKSNGFQATGVPAPRLD